ncbi:hypothetical protein ACFRMN_32605 [Streptomyces sp. NPDC056835]|uniref:effector-associated constant component EACC1 n=1 Tax=Streptomyces sp. NPDC056835 TaxID=3345956 RepID=UPI0036CEA19C
MPEYQVRFAAGPAEEEDREEELRSLLRWLTEDESLDRAVRGAVRGDEPLGPGHMGAGFDLLQLAVGTAVSTASLVVSVLQWQTSRRRGAPAVVLRRGGAEIELSREASADPELFRRAVELLDRAEESGDDGGTD